MTAALVFVAVLEVVLLVATSDVAEDDKADDDEYDDAMFLADDATADDDFNTEKQSPMASWLSNRMRVLDRFIVGI